MNIIDKIQNVKIKDYLIYRYSISGEQDIEHIRIAKDGSHFFVKVCGLFDDEVYHYFLYDKMQGKYYFLLKRCKDGLNGYEDKCFVNFINKF